MKKKFDCVEMTRKIRDEHFKVTKKMTLTQRIDFINKQSKLLQDSLLKRKKVTQAF